MLRKIIWLRPSKEQEQWHMRGKTYRYFKITKVVLLFREDSCLWDLQPRCTQIHLWSRWPMAISIRTSIWIEYRVLSSNTGITSTWPAAWWLSLTLSSEQAMCKAIALCQQQTPESSLLEPLAKEERDSPTSDLAQEQDPPRIYSLWGTASLWSLANEYFETSIF